MNHNSSYLIPAIVNAQHHESSCERIEFISKICNNFTTDGLLNIDGRSGFSLEEECLLSIYVSIFATFVVPQYICCAACNLPSLSSKSSLIAGRFTF